MQTKTIRNKGRFSRIVCCSNESVDVLIRLGCSDMIVGRPSQSLQPEVKHANIVGGYGSIDPQKVLSLNPDIVITYSDYQHNVASELIRNHQCVLATNQLNVMEILDTIECIGAIAGVPTEAASLRRQMVTSLKKHLKKANEMSVRPRVYFEEWNDPMICGVEWVSEMIEIAGGQDIFRNRSKNKGHHERQVSLTEIIENDPDIIIASWCGKPANLQEIASRDGWQAIRAVKNQHIFEMRPEITLQPGPRIIEGIAEMSKIFRKWDS